MLDTIIDKWEKCYLKFVITLLLQFIVLNYDMGLKVPKCFFLVRTSHFKLCSLNKIYSLAYFLYSSFFLAFLSDFFHTKHISIE